MLASGSGITPCLSMAKAIADGTLDFNLTIIFGNRTEDSILFKDELEELLPPATRSKSLTCSPMRTKSAMSTASSQPTS